MGTEADSMPLGCKPLFTLNDEPEQAIRTLKGVSCALAMFSMTDEGSMNHRNTMEMFEMLSGVTDACTEALSGAAL